MVQELSPEERRQQTANHEAGHYVAAYVTGAPHHVFWVTIEPGVNPKTGAPGRGENNINFDEATPEQWALFLMAGPVAQAYGAKRRNGWEAQDEEFLIEWRRAWGEAKMDREEFVERIGREPEPSDIGLASEFAAEHWGTIEAISAILYTHGTIFGKEAESSVLAYAAQHAQLRMYLEAYRKHRRKETPPEEFKIIHPGVKWCECLSTFLVREGPRQDAGIEEIGEWFALKMAQASK